MNHPTPTMPEAPAIHPVQAAGIACILLVPVLALLGLFGESFDRASTTSSDLSLDIEYSTRYRYKMINDLNVLVTNESDQTIPALTVYFSRDYIDQFSTVTFTPPANQLTREMYVVELTGMAAGESRGITVELQGERYGEHRGTVSADGDGLQAVEVKVTTFIFP